jgi:hypothetical protein
MSTFGTCGNTSICTIPPFATPTQGTCGNTSICNTNAGNVWQYLHLQHQHRERVAIPPFATPTKKQICFIPLHVLHLNHCMVSPSQMKLNHCMVSPSQMKQKTCCQQRQCTRIVAYVTLFTPPLSLRIFTQFSTSPLRCINAHNDTRWSSCNTSLFNTCNTVFETHSLSRWQTHAHDIQVRPCSRRGRAFHANRRRRRA